jgi:hypothetical protein
MQDQRQIRGKTFQNLASVAVSGAAATAVTPLPHCTVTPAFMGNEELPAQADIQKFGETRYWSSELGFRQDC